MSNSIWATLSAIDCNEHAEKKGQFNYLAWTWAWAMVKENYPRAYYSLEPDIVYPNGTMEVRVNVGIPEGDDIVGLTHQMWLPVLDNKNNAIKNPDSFDINSARMRCLVKCLAMFGLGHYIYAGESMPQPQGLSDEEYQVFVGFVAEKDGLGLLKYMEEIGSEKCTEAYNRAPQGQKVKFKDSVKVVQDSGQEVINTYVNEIEGALDADDPDHVKALLEEVKEDGEWLKTRVWARLTPVAHEQIKQLLKEAA